MERIPRPVSQPRSGTIHVGDASPRLAPSGLTGVDQTGLLASDERMAVVTSLPDIKRYIRIRQM